MAIPHEKRRVALLPLRVDCRTIHAAQHGYIWKVSMYHPYRMDLFSIYDVIKAGYMENDGKMCPYTHFGALTP